MNFKRITSLVCKTTYNQHRGKKNLQGLVFCLPNILGKLPEADCDKNTSKATPGRTCFCEKQQGEQHFFGKLKEENRNGVVYFKVHELLYFFVPHVIIIYQTNMKDWPISIHLRWSKSCSLLCCLGGLGFRIQLWIRRWNRVSSFFSILQSHVVCDATYCTMVKWCERWSNRLESWSLIWDDSSTEKEAPDLCRSPSTLTLKYNIQLWYIINLYRTLEYIKRSEFVWIAKKSN